MQKIKLIVLLVSCSLISVGQQKNKEWIALLKKEASFYYKNGDYYNALNFYNRIIAVEPQDEEAHILAVYSKFKLSYPLDSTKTLRKYRRTFGKSFFLMQDQSQTIFSISFFRAQQFLFVYFCTIQWI